jgi:hypothetical protein
MESETSDGNVSGSLLYEKVSRFVKVEVVDAEL